MPNAPSIAPPAPPPPPAPPVGVLGQKIAANFEQRVTAAGPQADATKAQLAEWFVGTNLTRPMDAAGNMQDARNRHTLQQATDAVRKVLEFERLVACFRDFAQADGTQPFTITSDDARLLVEYIDRNDAKPIRGRMDPIHPLPWTYEVHELSEGFSAIIYDDKGIRVVDHLDEATANQIVKGVNGPPAKLPASPSSEPDAILNAKEAAKRACNYLHPYNDKHLARAIFHR